MYGTTEQVIREHYEDLRREGSPGTDSAREPREVTLRGAGSQLGACQIPRYGELIGKRPRNSK